MGAVRTVHHVALDILLDRRPGGMDHSCRGVVDASEVKDRGACAKHVLSRTDRRQCHSTVHDESISLELERYVKNPLHLRNVLRFGTLT